MSGNKRRRAALGGTVVAAAAAVPFVGGGQVEAAGFEVTNTLDSGPGSLRQAIADANSTGGADAITFQSGLTGTIVLTSGELHVSDDLTISGPGAGLLSIDGNDSSRVFYLYDDRTLPLGVTISGLTITNGATIGFGGDIYSADTNLTLQSVIVSSGRADQGGGIFVNGVTGSLTMNDSQLVGNDAVHSGGGLFVQSTRGATLNAFDVASGVTIERSLISGNDASPGGQGAANGGGVFLNSGLGPVLISETTIRSNTAADNGGGVYVAATGTSFAIDRSTTSGNGAGGQGGGLWLRPLTSDAVVSSSTVTGNSAIAGGGVYVQAYSFYYAVGGLAAIRRDTVIEHSTISGNSAEYSAGNIDVVNRNVRAAARVSLYGGQLQLDHTIVADGVAPQFPDVYSFKTVYADFSLVEQAGFIATGGGNIVGQDPQLGALLDNGGLTETRMPAFASPARNAGDAAIVMPPAVDQRGASRVRGTAIDIGAVELAPAPLNDAYSTPEDTVLTVPAAGVLTNDGGNTSVVIATQPTHGTVSLAANGGFVYTPAANFNGSDSFTYTANDGSTVVAMAAGVAGSVVTGTATVSLTVTAVNDPPVGVDDTGTVAAGDSVTVAVLGNDSDPEGDALSVVSVTQGSKGTAAIQGGLIVYTARAGSLGADSFTYVLSDGKSSVTVTVRITVNAPAVQPPPPVPEPQLPATGGRSEAPLTGGFVLTFAGAAMVLASRRRTLAAD